MRRLLAATAAVVLLAGCDGSGGDPDPDRGAAAGSDTSESGSESASESPTGDPGPVVTCPDATLLDPDPELPDEVPEGATSVRLCDGGDGRLTPPVDALTTDVASVVAAVNDQPLVGRNCVDRRIPEYQLAFGYPDGTDFVVAGRFTGCGELLVGSGRRVKAGPPLRAFVDGLRDQRSTATPPDQTVAPADLDCGRPPSNLPAPVALPPDLDVAVLCSGPLQHPDRAARVEIADEDLTAMVASMREDFSSSEGYLGCGPFPRNEYWIVGASAWGDPIVMRYGCFGLTIQGYDEWTPRGQARAILRGLITEAR